MKFMQVVMTKWILNVGQWIKQVRQCRAGYIEHPKVIFISIFVVLISCQEEQNTLFTSLSSNQTNIDFANIFEETEALNINEYLYAYNGGGVAIGDINNDGLPDIYFTANQLANRLYLNQGDFQFKDITESAGVAGLFGEDKWTTGAAMADVNDDGWLDIYVSQVSGYKQLNGRNQLFINNGDLTFTEQAAEFGLDVSGYAQQVAFFDYDLDGDLDMYQLNHSVHNADSYQKATIRLKRDSLAGDRLFRNENGQFVDVSEEAGIYGGTVGYGLAVGVGDINNDGCPDIYVSNDFHENDYVYYNNCDGTFREDIRGTLSQSSTFSMGNDLADFNNDGLLDIMSLDMKPYDEAIKKQSAGADPYNIYEYKLSFGYFYQFPRNMLQLNQGNLFESNVQFSEIGQLAGVAATDWSWSTLFADLDNDGWKDIFITNGIVRRPNDLDYINYTYNEEVQKKASSLEMAAQMPDGAVPNFAYRNKGNLQFEDVSKKWGLDWKGCSMGTAYGDLDNDGDLDLVVNNLNSLASIYRNTSSGNNYLKVKLNGKAGNRFGIGAKIEITTDAVTQMQVLNPVRGWLSAVDHTLLFGLGKAEIIDELKVTWSDGRIQLLKDVKINQTLTLDQKLAQPKEVIADKTPKLFKDVSSEIGVDFVHIENQYIDFNQERLIPHKLSTEGPSIAVADVNGDGFLDFHIGGAFGQAGAIYLNQSNSSFQKVNIEALAQDKNFEDVEATFFDADGDSDLDLYVVSGGGQSVPAQLLQDRLYLNDGQGNFSKATTLPYFSANGACVVAADFDDDGDEDLFVGTRSVVGAYGQSPDAHLLWNDGQGQFELATIEKLGMVTDAAWLSETKKLAVVGTWMPITFLKFTADKIATTTIPDTEGWWNTIHAADLDNDGDLDLLGGNLGLNSDLKATTDQPLELLVEDFDRNNSIDPILTYHVEGKQWVYDGLDKLKKQLPSLQAQYATFTEFSEDELDDIFPTATADTKKKAVQLASIYLINNGNDSYTTIPLPTPLQYAPIYAFTTNDFDEDGNTDIIAVGNFDGNTPALGRFNASFGNLLLGKPNGSFEDIAPRKSGFAVYGAARDAVKIDNHLIVARNNAPIRVFKVESAN